MRAWGYEGGGRGARRETPYSREGESADACTVFVGNLPFEVTWRELKQHMAAAGEVAFADVKSGPDGRSKGVGIVRYATEAEALNAIETLSETDLGGREIFVRAFPSTMRPQGGKGGRGASGGGGMSRCPAEGPQAGRRVSRIADRRAHYRSLPCCLGARRSWQWRRWCRRAWLARWAWRQGRQRGQEWQGRSGQADVSQRPGQ